MKPTNRRTFIGRGAAAAAAVAAASLDAAAECRAHNADEAEEWFGPLIASEQFASNRGGGQ